MSLVKISELLDQQVDRILNTKWPKPTPLPTGASIVDRPDSNQFHMEVEIIYLDANTGERKIIKPLTINEMVINADFADNYMDEIFLTVSLTPPQLLAILDNYRHLKAFVSIKNVDTETTETSSAYAFLGEYMLVLKDKEIRKRFPKEALSPKTAEAGGQKVEMCDNIEFQLITELSYKVRKKRFNFIARDASVSQVIKYMAQLIDVPYLALIPPDNTTKYENFVMPPDQTFVSAMKYLQEYYGVYNKGISFYFVGETLYVYPKYDTDIPTEIDANFYFIGANKYAGAKAYHAYDTNDIPHIVLNQDIAVHDLTDAGVENIGNDITVHKADRVMHKQHTIYEPANEAMLSAGMNTIDISELNTERILVDKDDIGIEVDSYNPAFRFDYNNRAAIVSDLYSYRRIVCQTSWPAAVPNIFTPGKSIRYYYDDEDPNKRISDAEYSHAGVLRGVSGIIDKVVYTLKPAVIARIRSFNTVADITMSLAHTPAREIPQIYKRKNKTKK